jgi:Ankyrin repeats (many copies)
MSASDFVSLHDAAKAGDLVEVGKALAAGIDVNAPDKLKRTPLHMAAWAGRTVRIHISDADWKQELADSSDWRAHASRPPSNDDSVPVAQCIDLRGEEVPVPRYQTESYALFGFDLTVCISFCFFARGLLSHQATVEPNWLSPVLALSTLAGASTLSHALMSQNSIWV